VRHHFVREYVEDEILKIVFVRSEDNKADSFTKNLNSEGYKKSNDGYMDTVHNRKGVKDTSG
jgi:hypothetical protein